MHHSMFGVSVEPPIDGASVQPEGGADAAAIGASAGAAELGLSISTKLTEGQAVRGKSYKLAAFKGASYAAVRAVGTSKQQQVGGGKRKPCTGFSDSSRRAMQKAVSQLKESSVVTGLFITLTYPRNFPDGKRAKRDLDVFVKRLLRAHPGAAGLWKLEPQERGAPHFHLLVLGVEFIPHEWLAKAWFEVVGSRDLRHFAAGTEVRRVKSYQHATRYVSKYIAKETAGEAGDGLGEVGRRWGRFGDWSAHLGELVIEALDHREAAQLLRILDQKRLASARRIQNPKTRARAIKRARRRRPLKLSQYWLGSPDFVLLKLMQIIGRGEHASTS